MRNMRMVLPVLLLMSCDAPVSPPSAFDATDAAWGSSSGGVVDPGSSTTGDPPSSSEGVEDPGLRLDVGSPDPGGPSAVVYGQDASTLYRLDPETFELDIVGPFSGCHGSVIDLAVDRNGAMRAVTYDSLWAVNPVTGACSLIAEGSFPTSLSYVPKGTVSESYEALVGFVGAQYVEINPVSGAQTALGLLPAGLESSGDLVSVKDGPTWLTVRGIGCEDQDCLVALDPRTGELVAAYGRIGYDQVFGLAAWGGRAYGFAREGVVFEVQVPGPVIIEVSSTGPEWFGAGSSTTVPAG